MFQSATNILITLSKRSQKSTKNIFFHFRQKLPFSEDIKKESISKRCEVKEIVFL